MNQLAKQKLTSGSVCGSGSETRGRILLMWGQGGVVSEATFMRPEHTELADAKKIDQNDCGILVKYQLNRTHN